MYDNYYLTKFMTLLAVLTILCYMLSGCSYHVIDSNQETINRSLVDKNYTGGVTSVEKDKDGNIIFNSKDNLTETLKGFKE